MAKVICICGRICSGKSTYAAALRRETRAVVLSVDEITLALFGRDVGEKHDTYVERTERYLFDKSVELLETGFNVILDWGFWTREERDYARGFYLRHGIPCELHYIDVSPGEWRARREKRNDAILHHGLAAYYVDEGLAAKFGALFEEPAREDVDVWVNGGVGGE